MENYIIEHKIMSLVEKWVELEGPMLSKMLSQGQKDTAHMPLYVESGKMKGALKWKGRLLLGDCRKRED